MVEAFLVGIGLGILMGIATCYLIISRPKAYEPQSWREIIDNQMTALEELEGNRLKPRALTRLTSHSRTVEL